MEYWRAFFISLGLIVLTGVAVFVMLAVLTAFVFLAALLIGLVTL